jgi:biotin operon repressor
MEKNTQSRWVLKALQNGELLSSKDAVINYGIQDLPKRISELRQQGYPIESQRVEGVNRYGYRTHWHLYFLAG